MLTIAALNAPKAPSSRSGLAGGAGGGGAGAAAGETLEAAESRCVEAFEAALPLVQSDPSAAKAAFESLLAEPILAAAASGGSAATSSVLVQVRVATLRNLAMLLSTPTSPGVDAEAEDEDARRALGLYAQASLAASEPGGQGTDAVTWQRLGTLAAELRMWPLARQALEQGLLSNPKHPLLLESLASLCLRLGDWRSAASASARLLENDAGHGNAAAMLRAAEAAARSSSSSDGGYEEAMAECDPPVFPSRDRVGADEGAEDKATVEEKVSVRVASPSFSSLLVALADVVFRSPGDRSWLLSLPAEVEVVDEGREEEEEEEVEEGAEREEPAAAKEATEEKAAGGAAAAAAPVPPQRTGSASVRGPLAPPTRALTNAANANGGCPSSSSSSPVDALEGVLPWLGLAPPTPPAATAAAVPKSKKGRGPSAEEREAVGELASTAGPCCLGELVAAAVDAAAAFAESTSSPSYGSFGSSSEDAPPPPLTRPAAYALLSLEPLSRSWKGRRSPLSSLALAELHAAVAVEAEALVGRDADGGAVPPRHALRSSAKRAEAEHAEAATACLAAATPVVSPGETSGDPFSETATKSAVTARWRWVAGRLAELRRSPRSAEEHYKACEEACQLRGELAVTTGGTWDGRGPPSKGAPSGVERFEPRAVRLPLVSSLVGDASAPEAVTTITAAAAASRTQALGLLSALETGRARLSGGGPDEAALLVDELAPRVLQAFPLPSSASSAASSAAAAAAATGEARRKLAEAALLLQDAAAAAGPAHDATQLRARMLLLSSMLPRPPPPPESRTTERHAARPDGSEGAPPGCADPARAAGPKLERLLGSLSRFALALADGVEDGRGDGRTSIAPSLAPGTAAAREVHELLWKVAAHVERCYWACGIAGSALTKAVASSSSASAAAPKGRAPAAPLSPSSSSSPEVRAAWKALDAAKRALGTACAALIALWRLDSGVCSASRSREPPFASEGTAEATASLLRALGKLVSSRELPANRRAPMLRAAARALSSAVARIEREEEEETGGGDDGEDDDPHDLRGALAAALGALYGADLPGRDPTWPATEGLLVSPAAAAGSSSSAAPTAVPPAGVAPLSTVAECLEAWKLLEPTALLEASEAEREHRSSLPLASSRGGSGAASSRSSRPRSGRRSPLSRLDAALRNLEGSTPPPSDEVLSSWDPGELLDAADEGEGEGGRPRWPTGQELVSVSVSSPSSPSTAALEALFRVPSSLADAVARDPCSPIHRTLHLVRMTNLASSPSALYSLLQTGPAAAAGAFLSGAGGAGVAALEKAVEQPLLALRYAPASDPRPWRALALSYSAAAEALLADAARVPAVRWWSDSRSRERLEGWRNRSLRAALAWRAVAAAAGDSASAADADEVAGRALLSAASRDPPNSARAPRGGDAGVGASASLAAEAFARAAEEDPTRWRPPFLLGRALEKAAAAGASSASPEGELGGKLAALPLYARACALAATDEGSGYQAGSASPGKTLLEPIYRLHACRLKVSLAARRACEGSSTLPPVSVLDAVSRWCFEGENASRLAPLLSEARERERGGGTPAAAAVVALADDGADSDDDASASVRRRPPSPSAASEALDLLLDDALAALSWCADADRYYHKARYRLARGLAARGAPPSPPRPSTEAASAALEALRPLFTPSSASGGGGFMRTRYCIATYQITEEGGGGGGGAGVGDGDAGGDDDAGDGDDERKKNRRRSKGGEEGAPAPPAPSRPSPPPPPSSSPAADPFYGARGGGGVRGAGEAETWRGHARRVSAHVRFHARLAWQLATAPESGDASSADAEAAARAAGRAALASAASFLSNRSNREGLPGLEAAARLVVGLHFLSVSRALREHARGGWLVESEAAAAGGGGGAPSSKRVVVRLSPALADRGERRAPAPPEVSQALERAFALYSSHSLFPDRAGVAGFHELASAGAEAAAAVKGSTSASDDPWATEGAFAAAARAHVSGLEASGDFEKLASLASQLRRRHRPIRDAPRAVRALFSDASGGASRALAAAVRSMEAAGAAGAGAELDALVAAKRREWEDGARDDFRVEEVDEEDPRALLSFVSSRAASAARDAGISAASAAGWPADKAWGLLRSVASARSSGGWGGGAGGGGDGSGGEPLSPSPSASAAPDLDSLLRRAYAAYCWLSHGASLGVSRPGGGSVVPFSVSLSEASASTDDLSRAAKRAASAVSASAGGPPQPPVPISCKSQQNAAAAAAAAKAKASAAAKTATTATVGDKRDAAAAGLEEEEEQRGDDGGKARASSKPRTSE